MTRISHRLSTSLVILVVGLFFFSLLPFGNDIHRNNSHSEISIKSIRKGRALASRYCQSCHMLPDPSLLDSKTWEKGIMPQMGPRLGIFKFWLQQYPSEIGNRNLSKGYYPSKPQISLEEWQDIINYYIASSPDSLQGQSRQQELKANLPFFNIQSPPVRYAAPATGFVKISTDSKLNGVIISDVIKKTIYRYTENFDLIDSVNTSGPIVNMELTGNSLVACNIGVLYPHVGKLGTAEHFRVNTGSILIPKDMSSIKELERPVQLSIADFNNDGREDYLACEFGYLTGSLSWFENLGDDKYKKHILRPMPGAIRAYVDDFNSDRLKDVWVLFTQGEEGIFLFTNNGHGRFSSKEVLRFPPVYGSSYFDLVDFDKDGYQDIIYTAGDNADFSPILKPYHGVYIFINNGNNEFKQKYFFQINGCYKALARDYDQDGDLDIATIAFFADYDKQPEESFVYLENKGGYFFIPYTFPESKLGRWLTMDAGDIDKDGKIDLILGNFSITRAHKKETNWQKGPPFIVLKNISK